MNQQTLNIKESWWKLLISFVYYSFKLDKDICYRNSLLDQDHQLHKIQLMSMMRDIMTIFWSNLFLTPKNIWCCDGKMNILCITTFTFYLTRETSSWCLHSTFTFTFYFSWRRDWCLLVGVCGNVCAISTNTSHYQPQSDTQCSDNQRPLITNANTEKCWRVKCFLTREFSRDQITYSRTKKTCCNCWGAMPDL